MKTILIYSALLLALSAPAARCQLTVEMCQEKARTNYPLVQQYGLIEQSKEYSLSNAKKGWLPQFSLSAKATYQSEVTELPIKLPNIKITPMDKDQYQSVAEANQLVWDGGAINSQKEITRATSDVEKEKLNVEIYTLNDRVNNLFFGILLLDRQIRQNDILQTELRTNFEKVTAYIKNGIANQADLDAIRVEILNAGQRRTELLTTRKSYITMLSIMTNQQIDENTALSKPAIADNGVAEAINNRPELKLYEAQRSLYENQISTINAANMPKISVFMQGGYGKPGLNMLKNEFSSYYVGGIRLSWNFSGFYTKSNSLDIIAVNQKTVDIQKNTFLFNSRLTSAQQSDEIQKTRRLIADDDEIIGLRTNIKKSAEAKVANGTLTVTDLIREINAEDTAMQNKAMHEIQLINAVYKLKNTLNN
jgi:outer membrane protein TolC